MDATRIGIIVGMALLTYALRAIPYVFFTGRTFPGFLDRYLRYLSYALIATIISTTLFLTRQRFDEAAAGPRSIALLAAVLVAARSGSPLLGLVTGTVLVLTLHMI